MVFDRSKSSGSEALRLTNVVTLLQCRYTRWRTSTTSPNAPACRSPRCPPCSTTPRLSARRSRRASQAAVAALGYQPNLLARSLAKQRTQTLGMIVPDIANPFFPEVVRGAEDVAHAAGYTLLIASSDNDLRKEEVYLRLFLAKRVDGVILTKAPGPDAAGAAARARQGRRAGRAARAHRARVHRRRRRARRQGRRLRGRRRICCGSATGASASSAACAAPARAGKRLDGYRAALRDAEIPLDPALVAEGDFRVESGYRAGLELLEGPARRGVHRELPDDASGSWRRCGSTGCAAPRMSRIVTCDDHPWLDSFSPRLTTIDLPKRELGAAAAQLLVERIAKGAGRAAHASR